MARGAGGTSGGLGTFFIGALMAGAGFYMIARKVIIHSGFNSYFYGIPFGVTLLPLCIGIAVLFFNAKSVLGWILTGAGFLIIILEIILSLRMYLQPASLFEWIIMLVLLLGGFGLVFRSFKSR